uniref:Uncharacterized LOC113137211 n=1 Tax=Mastacembelus armatus TaxID=205130 RepID=A0A7N8WWZ4_9TELE
MSLCIEAQRKPSRNIQSKCLGNIMRVDVGSVGGKRLEVSAVINNSAVVLTESLASQCGFSMKLDQLGNVMIFASLHNCFAQNVKDTAFTTTLNIRLYGSRMAKTEAYQVTETCHYIAWASREILCNSNYMEVSVKRTAADKYTLANHFRRGKWPIDTGSRIMTLVFFTPEEKVMTVAKAQNSGYGIVNTPSRLVVRSPKTTPETYTQSVAGVPMTVLKMSAIFEQKWLATQIDVTAACPMLEGSVYVTPNTVTWYLPWHIDPLISSDQFKLLEVYMGIDGQRLNATEMAARQYSMSANDMYIIVEIPVGAVGGYFKSQVQDGQYFIYYTIEPMLELLWIEEAANEDTRYKVFLPITTPLQYQPPQVTDDTVPEEQIFKVLLGPLGSDVVLINITFPSEVLSVADCNIRGFNIMEHTSPNSSLKVFSLVVPFTDPVVHQTRGPGFTVYSLHLTFGLLVVPEFTQFSHTVYLEQIFFFFPPSTVPPQIIGGCDHQNFYVLVKYETHGFQTIIGKQILTPTLAEQYNFIDNGTHFSIVVPFSSPDTKFEAIESSSIRSRLDVVLMNQKTKNIMKEFSMSCKFHSTLIECFPNGTITALAVKLNSVPSLNPSQLTLRDPMCRPSFSDDRYAYFIFSGNSCGTTRKFLANVMLYENEISLPEETETESQPENDELKISCYYDVNSTSTVAFYTSPSKIEPRAKSGKGELQVEMRLALDNSYSTFYKLEDYPVSKYLKQPLYFEVELIAATNPSVSLELENCWATLNEDRRSHPRLNLIIDGCANPLNPYQVIFHPVWVDARVQYPSRFKRFEVQMFTFPEDDNNFDHHQLFVHCDVVICDNMNPLGGVCSGQCSSQKNKTKGQRRAVSHVNSFKHVSSGLIVMI